MVCAKDKLALSVPQDMAPLLNERLNGRLKQMGKLIGREPTIRVL
jgi:exopolyphosphatase/guanosine-5'-triphosphate,3'-diphosphate pyrophosphatase